MILSSSTLTSRGGSRHRASISWEICTLHRLINRTADTESDAEMLQLIANTRILPYARSYQLQFGALYHEIFLTNKNVASYYEAHKNYAEKTLEKVIVAYEDMKNN